jgi:hypothetical protein
VFLSRWFYNAVQHKVRWLNITLNNQEKILRASSRFWKQDIGAVILFLIILPIIFILYLGGEFYFVGGLALIVGLFSIISEVRSARSQQITFSKSEIIVRIGKEDFKWPWETIKAVRFTGQGQSRLLTLYNDEYNLNIPCKYYDETELVENLKKHLSSSTLHPQAYQTLPHFLEWKENFTKKLSTINEPLKISLGGSEKWLGLFCVSLGVLFAGLYYFSKVDAIAAFMIGGMFGGLGLLLLVLSIGWMEGDRSQISVRSLFRKNTFLWSDLREIYFNSNQGVIALVGDNSRIIIPKFSSWSGKDKELLDELIGYKIEMSKIEPIESNKPVFWLSKNA